MKFLGMTDKLILATNFTSILFNSMLELISFVKTYSFQFVFSKLLRIKIHPIFFYKWQTQSEVLITTNMILKRTRFINIANIYEARSF